MGRLEVVFSIGLGYPFLQMGVLARPSSSALRIQEYGPDRPTANRALCGTSPMGSLADLSCALRESAPTKEGSIRRLPKVGA